MPHLDSGIEPLEAKADDQRSVWQELSGSFLNETKVQLKGLAQTVGAGDLVNIEAEAHQADGVVAQHAQMFGRAAADAIPIIIAGAAIRAGFGRMIASSSEPGLLLQRSALGLSAAETATTGFITGSLLHPSDSQHSDTVKDLLVDRVESGVSGALSFVAINAASQGISSIAARSESSLASILKNPAAVGFVSGIPAGLVNPQIDSLVHRGKFNSDFSQTGSSMYESALVGTVFGGLSLLRGSSPTDVVSENSFTTKSESQAAITHSTGDKISLAVDKQTADLNGSISLEKLNTDEVVKPENADSVPSDRIILSTLDDQHSPIGFSKSAPYITLGGPLDLSNLRSLIGPSETHKVGFILSDHDVSEDFKTNHFHNDSPHDFFTNHIAEHESFFKHEKFSDSFLMDHHSLGKTSFLGDSIVDHHSSMLGNEGFGDVMSSIFKEYLNPKDPITYEPSMNYLKEQFGNSSDEYKALEESKFNNHVKNIADFIAENPEKNKPIVSDKILAGEIPDTQALMGFAKLDARLGDGSAIVQFLKDQPRTHQNVNALADYVNESPESRIQRINELVESKANWREFDPTLLKAEETIKAHIAENNSVYQKFQQARDAWVAEFPKNEEKIVSETISSFHKKLLEGFTNDLISGEQAKSPYERIVRGAAAFVEMDPKAHLGVLERAVRDGVPFDKTFASTLESRKTIESTFGLDSPTTTKLLSQLTEPKYLEALATILKETPEAARVTERLIEHGAPNKLFDNNTVIGLYKLDRVFGRQHRGPAV